MSKTVYGGKVTIDFWREIMLAAHELNLHRVMEAPPVPIAIRTKVSPVPTKSETDLPTEFDATGIDEVVTQEAPPTKTKPPRNELPPDDANEEGPPPVETPGETTRPESERTEKGPTEPSADPKPPREKPVRVSRQTESVTARDAAPKAPKQKVTKLRESSSVVVNICVDSGLRATDYCNETVERTFVKGKEPRGKCQIHPGGG
jgi:hypothetical protein